MEIASLSDIEILTRSQKHPWMFGFLVDRYEEPLLRRSLRILHSREDAEDAVQETFLKIYKYANQFKESDRGSFKSWAYKILTNTCYTHISKKASHSCVQTFDFADLDEISGGHQYAQKESQSYVESILSRIPAKFSRILRLYFFEEKTYEEIANVECISVSATRSRIHRAKKYFKTLALTLT